MGILIFAYRKLFLTRKINDLNFQLMQISQQQQTMTEKIGTMNDAMSNAKNMISMNSSYEMNSIMQGLQGKYYDETGNVRQGVNPNQMYSEMQQAQYQTMMKTNYVNNIFEQQSKMEMQQLNQIDTQLTMKQKTLESQLKQLNGELDGVEKAEDNAAKQCAPKFGLG